MSIYGAVVVNVVVVVNTGGGVGRKRTELLQPLPALAQHVAEIRQLFLGCRVSRALLLPKPFLPMLGELAPQGPQGAYDGAQDGSI